MLVFLTTNMAAVTSRANQQYCINNQMKVTETEICAVTRLLKLQGCSELSNN